MILGIIGGTIVYIVLSMRDEKAEADTEKEDE